MVRYELEEKPDHLEVKLEETGEKKEALLEAFQACREGRCGCPTTEYEKLGRLEVEASGDRIALRLEPKEGEHLDADEIARCLDHTVEAASRDE
ncbi:MAG: hypothetical protein P1V51_00870 [Deltaproteobacteria bacterium]|nr:hypothetical protein [Deltaproteobacteria bacterium]